MQPYLNKEYHLYFDNFYSTIKLFQGLEKANTHACGTIKKEKGKFQQEFHEKLQQGEMKFLHAGNVLAVHWFDKCNVYVISTTHGTGKSEVQTRGNQELIDKPNILLNTTNT